MMQLAEIKTIIKSPRDRMIVKSQHHPSSLMQLVKDIHPGSIGNVVPEQGALFSFWISLFGHT